MLGNAAPHASFFLLASILDNSRHRSGTDVGGQPMAILSTKKSIHNSVSGPNPNGTLAGLGGTQIEFHFK
jgi:hypothetical protein